MSEEYFANAERRRKIADDMAWSSGYVAGRAAERARHAALVAAAREVVDGRRCDCPGECDIAALRAALDGEPHTDDPATHDPRCISVSRWHVGECYLPLDGEPR